MSVFISGSLVNAHVAAAQHDGLMLSCRSVKTSGVTLGEVILKKSFHKRPVDVNYYYYYLHVNTREELLVFSNMKHCDVVGFWAGGSDRG